MGQNINEYGLSSGRMLKEDSVIINQADYLEKERQSNVAQMGRDGRLFRSFFQGTIPSATIWYFVIDIPEGVTLYGVSRYMVIESGDIRAAFFAGTGFTTIDATYPSFNFDTRSTAQAAACSMRRVSGPEGLVQHTPNGLITAPTTGPQRRPSTQTEIGAHVVHDSTSLPFFTLQNDTGNPEEVTLYLVWQELP